MISFSIYKSIRQLHESHWILRICYLILICVFSMIIILSSKLRLDLQDTEPLEKITIRVNTYRRMDLIEDFLKYYNECDIVDQIQVVWSDQENKPPLDWIPRYKKDKVIFEEHHNNSLVNRFRCISPLHTEAVLSIDDDLIVPCDVLIDSVKLWKSNKNALVGYTPRLHSTKDGMESPKYLRWQHTWWNGAYSIMLTKITLMHRKYLHRYTQLIPDEMNRYIDKHRNCEDLAMAHVVALETKAPPVWIRGIVYEVSYTGISSSSGHFYDRGQCLHELHKVTHSWPWEIGYQKMISINRILDFWFFFKNYLESS